MIRGFFIENLLKGVIEDEDEAQKRGKYLDISINDLYYQVIVCNIDYSSNSDGTAFVGAKNIMQYFLLNSIVKISEGWDNMYKGQNGNAIIHTSTEENVAIIFNHFNNGCISKMSNYFANEIIKSTNSQDDIIITIGIGNVFKGIKNIRFSYDGAKNAVKYKFLKGRNQIIDIIDVEPCSGVFTFAPVEYEKRLENAVKLGDYEKSKKALFDFFSYILESGNYYSINNIKVICWELASLAAVYKLFSRIGLQCSNIRAFEG